MRAERLSKVGIQRELHVEWFGFANRLHLSGFGKSEARQEIYEYLDSAPGFDAPPTKQTKTYVANVLIKSWIAPDTDIVNLRNDAATLIQSHPEYSIPLHWTMVGAAYPFWFAVSSIAGRLLNLQSQVTQKQVVTRLKETYGDRQTISRRARYVIRSFVAWGVLEDADAKGNYCLGTLAAINDVRLTGLMFEAALLGTTEGRTALNLLLRYPALFPFQFSTVSGDTIAGGNNRIEVNRYAMDEEMLRLKNV